MREKLIARFKHLTEVELPARAKVEHWPLHFDHCFKRVCLDWAYADVWYKHLEKPAEKHLDGEPLDRAVVCAEEILVGGMRVLRERNRASLTWRGKADPKAQLNRARDVKN